MVPGFRNNGQQNYYRDIGTGYSYRPDRPRLTRGNERSIVTSVYNRIALDAAAINIQHVRLDDNERFLEVIKSGLNNCLSLEANIDQTGRSFIQDIVMSMLDEGCSCSGLQREHRFERRHSYAKGSGCDY